MYLGPSHTLRPEPGSPGTTAGTGPNGQQPLETAPNRAGPTGLLEAQRPQALVGAPDRLGLGRGAVGLPLEGGAARHHQAVGLTGVARDARVEGAGGGRDGVADPAVGG